MLAMLDPTTFPNAKSGEPSRAAFKLTNNSGADVANETTVIPITNLERFNLNDKATEDRTKNSPPITNNIKPTIINAILILSNFVANILILCVYLNSKNIFTLDINL